MARFSARGRGEFLEGFRENTVLDLEAAGTSVGSQIPGPTETDKSVVPGGGSVTASGPEDIKRIINISRVPQSQPSRTSPFNLGGSLGLLIVAVVLFIVLMGR